MDESPTLSKTMLAEDAGPRRRLQMPLLLRVGMVGSVFLSVVLFIGWVALVLGQSSVFWINHEQVSRIQFLSGGGYVLFLLPLLLGGIGYGLWKERAWARPLMVFFWLILVTPSVISLLLGGGDKKSHLGALACLLIVVWYLYFKRNVVSYYRTVRSAQHS